MEVSSQDPSVVAMDLSKGYSVNPLSRGHAEAMDLAKKPEWYHRRPPGCSSDVAAAYRSRASSSYSSLSDAGAPGLCRDVEQGADSLAKFMNSTRAPGLDLYGDGVRGSLWHPAFYGPNQSGGPGPESSGGEDSDSGSDVIFLVSSDKEPLLCAPFLPDGVRHMVEPLSPAVSSVEDGRGCYRLPQPLSSPSPDSSYSEDSSDSSVDIPVHHARPVVLLSDLSAVYGNGAESPVDISSDDSDVIEVSVTNDKKKSGTFPCKKSVGRETPPQSEDEKAPPRKVRRSSRIRKAVSETPRLPCSVSRHSLRRRAKNDAVGIYNESCDSDDVMEYAVRLSSSDAEEPPPRRLSSHSEESGEDGRTPSEKSINHKRKKPVPHKTKNVRTDQKQKQSGRVPPKEHEPANRKPAVRRKKKKRAAAQFAPREPEIKLKYAKIKEEKKKKKCGGFYPFVHVERRVCTVVNYQEEEALVRSSPGGLQQSRSLSGFVPNTSCFQLGRSGPESRGGGALLCCLCGHTANATGLGDLHGPYHPTGPQGDGGPERTDGHAADPPAHAHRHPEVSSFPDSHGRPLPKVPLHLDECWIHEDCGIWSAGVFLVRGKLYGLAEAARLARETLCSACQQEGAIMGCFQKGCPRNYHYRCAIQSGCVLNEENFSIRCPEHKNKVLWCVSRQHKR